MGNWPLSSLLLTLLYQTVFFVITIIYRFDKVTDLAGASNFMLLAVTGLLAGGSFFRRQTVLTTMVVLWSLRLGAFLFLRVLVRRKDARFDKMRDSVVKLAGFWAMQVVWVFVVSLPVTFVNAARLVDVPIGTVDQAAWAVWLVGFVVEAVADQQRWTFNQTQRDPRGKPFLDTGLWRYSRHPNYFGEILVWTAVWISAAHGLYRAHPEQALLAAASPLLTFLLLVFVSGIPLAERRDDRRNHRLMAYKQYKFCTSPLVPMPPAWYAALPIWAKRWLFLDRYQLAFITPGLSRSLNASPSGRVPRTTATRSV